MKALHIDFAPSTWRRTLVHTSFWSWAMVSIALALGMGVMAQMVALAHRNSEAQTAIREAQSQLDARAMQKPVVATVQTSDSQVKGINAVVLQLNLPWRDLLEALEESTPPNIALLAIEPDAKRKVLNATAETRTDTEMIAYIEALKKQSVFDSVILVKHEVNAQDPNRPLRFQLEAQWSEAKP